MRNTWRLSRPGYFWSISAIVGVVSTWINSLYANPPAWYLSIEILAGVALVVYAEFAKRPIFDFLVARPADGEDRPGAAPV